MTTPYLVGDIKAAEGLRLVAYPDPITKASPWTIGYGHTGPEVHPGLTWSLAQADDQLASDIAAAQHQLDARLGWWRTLNDPRQDVLVQLVFNLGMAGLLEFKNTLALIKAGQFARARLALLNSRADRQLPIRYGHLADQLQTGLRAAS